MINGKNLCVVMPAYNAAQTLEKTYRELPFDIVDSVILVDDASSDDTLTVAKSLGIDQVVVHDKNLGYGGGVGADIKRCACEQPALVVRDSDPDGVA